MPIAIKKVYEDSEIIVIVKPFGINSEGGNSCNAADLLNDGGKPFIVHRLDREVGGLMVLAKSAESAAKLSKQIQDGNFKKEYLAVVEGELKEAEELIDLLFHDRLKNKTYVVKSARKGVKKAVLSYRLLSLAELDGKPVSKVRVKLQTGRTHQIRVQFASRKHPVLGDRKYGSKFNTSFALFSAYLSFKHPKTGAHLDFSELPPDTEPWNL